MPAGSVAGGDIWCSGMRKGVGATAGSGGEV